jgi:cell division protein FtsL
MTATTTVQQTARPVTSSPRRVRGFAVATAVLSTSLLYLVAKALGTDFELTDPGKQESHALILPEIAVFALVFSLLGWGTLALLERFTRRPKVIWSVLAIAVLVLSFVPIGIEQATVDTKVMLSVIHLAVAAALVPMLRRTGREATQRPTS